MSGAFRRRWRALCRSPGRWLWRPSAGAAGGHDPNKLDWPALLRKLDRLDPSYKG